MLLVQQIRIRDWFYYAIGSSRSELQYSTTMIFVLQDKNSLFRLVLLYNWFCKIRAHWYYYDIFSGRSELQTATTLSLILQDQNTEWLHFSNGHEFQHWIWCNTNSLLSYLKIPFYSNVHPFSKVEHSQKKSGRAHLEVELKSIFTACVFCRNQCTYIAFSYPARFYRSTNLWLSYTFQLTVKMQDFCWSVVLTMS